MPLKIQFTRDAYPGYGGYDVARLGFGAPLAGQQVIDQASSVVGGNKAASITIVGRTDATRTVDHNRQLSAKRAAAVHDALIATGQVAPDQIAVAWVGEKQQKTGPLSGFSAPGDRVVDIYIQ